MTWWIHPPIHDWFRCSITHCNIFARRTVGNAVAFKQAECWAENRACMWKIVVLAHILRFNPCYIWKLCAKRERCKLGFCGCAFTSSATFCSNERVCWWLVRYVACCGVVTAGSDGAGLFLRVTGECLKGLCRAVIRNGRGAWGVCSVAKNLRILPQRYSGIFSPDPI